MATQDCFTPEALENYALGKMTNDLSQLVSDHLGECEDCEQTLASVDGASDTLLEFLRMRRQPSQFEEEDVYQHALQSVKLLDRQDGGPEIDSSDDQAAEIEGSNLDLAASVADSEPLVIRDYQLVAKLGEGGMGAVFRAVHTKLDRTVALKLLPAERMRNQQAVARFERETRAVGKLDHPAIVRATDAGEIDGTWFLAMELVEGFDLARLSNALGQIAIADACELIRQTALGLQYAHEQGMVHRDIKPSNIMLAENGKVKILDFGLALLGGLHGSVDELTTVGQLMGTLDYMVRPVSRYVVEREYR